MTTLNARANQAWRDMEAELEREDYVPNFTSEQDAWEEGWETGYKTRSAAFPTEVQIAEVVCQIFINGGAARTHAQEAASEIAAAVSSLFNGGPS